VCGRPLAHLSAPLSLIAPLASSSSSSPDPGPNIPYHAFYHRVVDVASPPVANRVVCGMTSGGLPPINASDQQCCTAAGAAQGIASCQVRKILIQSRDKAPSAHPSLSSSLPPSLLPHHHCRQHGNSKAHFKHHATVTPSHVRLKCGDDCNSSVKASSRHFFGRASVTGLQARASRDEQHIHSSLM